MFVNLKNNTNAILTQRKRPRASKFDETNPNFKRKITLNKSKGDTLKAYQNIQFLKNLKHNNIIKLEETYKRDDKIVLKYESVKDNLTNTLKNKNMFLEENQIKKIFYQLVLSVYYLHSKKIEHNNINPKNIYLTEDFEVKLDNFTKAKTPFLSNISSLVKVNQTFYTSPEAMLNNNKNPDTQFKSDIWSLGCVFLTLLNRNDNLGSKKNYMKILKAMFQLLGKPSTFELDFVKSKSARKWINELKKYRTRLPSSYIKQPYVENDAKELLDLLLKIDPRKRPTCENILKHKYFSTIFNVEDLILSENEEMNRADFEPILLNIEDEEKQMEYLNKILTKNTE